MPESSPLLAPGLHPMTRKELKRLCVENFPESETRGQIALGLFFIIDRLAQSGITGEAWVDGSFLTEKIDPADADVVFLIPVEQYMSGTPRQREAIQWIAENLRGVLHCHTFVVLLRAPDDPFFAEVQQRLDKWRQLYGTDRNDNPKGIAVLKIKES